MVSRLLLLLCCLALGACATTQTRPSPGSVSIYARPSHVEEGIASWYTDKRTASGERYSAHALAAAHKKLPFGTKVRVIDLKTGKSIIVRINDRGPYKKGRVIDLTTGAARQLGTYHRGIAKVRIEVLKEIPVLQKSNLRATQKKKAPVPAPSPSPTPKKKSGSR